MLRNGGRRFGEGMAQDPNPAAHRRSRYLRVYCFCRGMGDAGALGMRGKRADLSGLVFGNLTVLLTWYRLEVPPMPLARADERFNKPIFGRACCGA